MPLGVPEVGAHDRASALEVDRPDRDRHHQARTAALDGEALQQVGRDAEPRVAVDAQRRAGAGNEEQQADARVPDDVAQRVEAVVALARSEEHTSELQSLMRISSAVFRLKKKKHTEANIR